ncbi:MAG: HAD family hydrolase [Thermodesulfobacteriota bacterium]
MKIKALAFDLFNTLVTAGPRTLADALDRLVLSLMENELVFHREEFEHAHWRAALQFNAESRETGRETKNRWWVAAALEHLGQAVPPDDPRIVSSVQAYFSAFIEQCRPIPGTLETLRRLKDLYPLGLLSNFTDAKAAKEIIERMGLAPLFEVVLISGDLGYRKPHPVIFQRLVDGLGVEARQILYVGDDPDADIAGARQSGINPVWMTYVRDKAVSGFPGYGPPGPEAPGPDVPKISALPELVTLLGLG